MPKIGFLGFGNMAQAIAKGIIESGFVNDKEIAVYDPDERQIAKFGKNIAASESALHLVKQVRYVFICVKPQVIEDALESITDGLTKNHILISIAAGVTVERIGSVTGGICPVVRVMPNTPLLLASGSTAIGRPKDIEDADYSFIEDVFSCVGTVYEIPLDKFNEVIPVNASSPAFVYLFAKSLAESAVKHGLDYSTALNMVSDTLIGSAKMLQNTGYSVDELIEMVSSKGGTTESALKTMKERGFVSSLEDGFDSCVARAYELGNGNNN